MNLTHYANEFLKEHYNLTLDVPIIRNNRLRRSLGRFIWSRDKKPIKIELAGFLLKYGHEEVIKDILRHELTHYALCRLGLPFQDGHPYFESELKRQGTSSTNTIMIGKYYVLMCLNCRDELVTDNIKHVEHIDDCQSGCCDANLKYVKTIMSDGINRKTLHTA